MERQNVTLSLPTALLKKAKVVAAQQGKSLSELMREALETRVNGKARYQQAMRRHLTLLASGRDLGTGGELNLSRDQIHER
jgi:metal-responsive CopG/Arc/MetJ family transcriptional regulator